MPAISSTLFPTHCTALEVSILPADFSPEYTTIQSAHWTTIKQSIVATIEHTHTTAYEAAYGSSIHPTE